MTETKLPVPHPNDELPDEHPANQIQATYRSESETMLLASRGRPDAIYEWMTAEATFNLEDMR